MTKYHKKFCYGKIFRCRDYRFEIRFKTFWIDSDQKKFSTKIFWLCHFFTIFAEKWLRKNFAMGKIFRFRNFLFKVRFKTLWIDSDQKKISTKFFDLIIFSLFWPFGRKTTKSHKKIAREKIFDFEIFVLKYVSKHSESIRTKKIFDLIFSTLSFLVRAPDSINGDGCAAGAASGAGSSFDEHAATG